MDSQNRAHADRPHMRAPGWMPWVDALGPSMNIKCPVPCIAFLPDISVVLLRNQWPQPGCQIPS